MNESMSFKHLPCGGRAVWDETGWRCLDCLCIYGSMACPCTGEEEKQDGSDDRCSE